MEENNNTMAPEHNATPAGTEGTEQGRTFTQDEVNAIIRDRLARERDRAGTSSDGWEQAIAAREAKLDCREYIHDKEYPATLLEVFDTSDAEAFKESVERLVKAFPQITSRPRAQYAPSNPVTGFYAADPLAEAFKPHK